MQQSMSSGTPAPSGAAALGHVTAVVSMLHESSEHNSATRTFRDDPVLAWTLERIGRARHLADIAVLCWEDQLEHVTPVAEEFGAVVLSKDPRVIVPAIESITAARRWSDGWRGGLLGTCDFDLGFHAPWVKEIVAELKSDAIVLVDPAAALVDPQLIDRIVEHAIEHESVQICFTQAAPGLAGVLIRPGLLEQLATARLHPGKILSYLPDQPVRDPIGGDGCVPVPAKVARTTRSFKLDSHRQIARISEASISLNGELLASDAEALIHRLAWSSDVDPLPREVVLEINTNRLSNPIHWPGRHLAIERPAMSLDLAKRLLDQIAQADDARLTLSGVGDALLHPQVFEILRAAQDAGVRAIHLETDLLAPDGAVIDALVDSRIDVVTLHIPAMTPQTYEQIMGIDGLATVLQNVRRFVARRHESARGVPLLVPAFTKMPQNLAEMEAWYDQWLRAIGCAVITGPSDYGAQIPDHAVADMSPPLRKTCARLGSRLTILSDGRAVSCEQDVLGRQVVGNMRFDSLAVVWNNGMRALREAQNCGQFTANPICGACKEWHRP